MKAKDNFLIAVIVCLVALGMYFAQKNHSEFTDEVVNQVKLSNQKDSTISILVSYIDVLKHDTAMYRLMITQKDSTIRVSTDKNNYMEFIISNKNKQITTISKNQSYDKKQCDKKLDSITAILNSFERVHVPD